MLAQRCPIWHTPARVEDSDKALLTTWLIERRSGGETITEFGTWFDTLIHAQEAMTDDQRSDHLLHYMKRCCPNIGDHFQYRVDPDPVLDCQDWIRYVEMLALSQSWKSTQLEYLVDKLIDEGLLKHHHEIISFEYHKKRKGCFEFLRERFG